MASLIVQGVPYKLLLISTGNIKNSELEHLFFQHLEALVSFDTRNPPRTIGTGGMFDYLRVQLPDFRIDDEDLEDLKTVRDAVDYVHSRVG